MTEKTNEEIADNIGKSGCWVEGCHYLSNPCPDCISRTQRIKKALDAKDAALLAVEKENGELKAALEWFIDWAIKDKEIKATADKAGWFVRALEMGRLRTNELISLKDELEKWHKLHDEFVETHDGGEPEPDFLEDVFSHIEQENYSLKAELEAMTTLFNKESDRLNWLDINTSFVADEKYCIGPYKVGELRAMADDGIAADKKHKPTTLRENLGQG